MGQDRHDADPARDQRAAAVVVHPHPGMGGDRHHPLVVEVCDGLAAAGVTAVRPDLRDPDPVASAWTLGSVAKDLLREVAADQLVLVGYSWGSVVAALAAPKGLVARVLVAPPLRMLELGDGDGTPTLVQVPAHDQYGGPDVVRAAVGGWPDTTVEVVGGADHFLAGAVTRIATRTVAWIDERLRSGSAPARGRTGPA